MKTFTLTCAVLLLSSIGLFAQSGMTIQGGGAVTVNGNLVITPDPNACGNPITDIRDGKTYNTVLIGNQCWFAQNLNVGTKILGSEDQTNNSINEKYCYEDNDANCAIYGGLYQWDEAMQYSTTEGVKGICPTGWHLPTDAEWTTLSTHLGGADIAGGYMKEAGNTHWEIPNTGATNSSGFTGLPGGGRYDDSYFNDLTTYADFWSSSQFDASTSWPRFISFNSAELMRGSEGYAKIDGFSVRCLKN